jgi:phosphate transport system substrate-binding protein
VKTRTHWSSRRNARRVVGVAIAVGIVFGAVAGPAAPTQAAVGTQYYPVTGFGSTWSADALTQWARNVWNNYKWQIKFTANGSSAGRQIFEAPGGGGADFAVSEIPYALKNSDTADPRPTRHFAYMPIVAGGTSFMYNLVIAGKRVTNLRLSGPTLAKIFTGVITKWNDPLVKADNPGLALPATPVIPVVRSDGSGTSAQFSAWMRTEYPSIWSAFCVKAGRIPNCGITSNFPTLPNSAFISQSGSQQVAGYVAQNQYVGAITYVEYAYALDQHFPVAKIENKGGYFTEPTAPNVAVSLLKAVINNDQSSPDYLTQQLTGVYNDTDPRTYPMSSYSYMIIPTALEDGFTVNKGLTLAAFANYFLCEGQQQAAVLGYSPLPINLAEAGLAQVLKIPGGDPTKVNIKKCNNPTFSTNGTNRLATTAPFPAACDKVGKVQCTNGTGGAKATSTAQTRGSSAGSTGATTGGTTGGTGTGTTGTGSGAASATDVSKPLTVAASPTTLKATSIQPWFIPIIAIAVGILLAVFVFVPPAMARRRPRSRAPNRRKLTSKIHLPARRRQRATAPAETEGA